MTTGAAAICRSFFRYLEQAEEIFLCLLLLVMILLACTQILLRDFFATGFVWADPLLRYMVIWAGLFGADVATKKGKHITIDIISYLVPLRLQCWLHAVIHLFSAAVCICLTYAALIFTRNEAAFPGNNGIFSIPSWVMNLAFPLAFGLISLRFLIRLAGNLVAIAKKQSCSD